VRRNVRVAEDYKVGAGAGPNATPATGTGGAAPQGSKTPAQSPTQTESRAKTQGGQPAAPKTPARRARARRGN
jgi:hypothetical protein